MPKGTEANPQRKIAESNSGGLVLKQALAFRHHDRPVK